MMVEGRRADGKGGHGNRSHHCGFRSEKVGRAMVGCGDCSQFSWQPSFWCWALGLVPCGAAHTRARRGSSLAIAMRMAEQKLPSTFLRDAIKSTAHPRADIIGTLDAYPSSILAFALPPVGPACSLCVAARIRSTVKGPLNSSRRSSAACLHALLRLAPARGVVCPVWSPFLC